MEDGFTERTAIQQQIKPLTRRNLKGEVYERLPLVEAQIREALALVPGRLMERAQVRKIDSPLYFQEETLVYLIREHYRENQRSLVDGLGASLVRRCAKRINNLVRGSIESRYVDDCFGHIVKEVFDRILDLDSDRGDFAQVRFWVFLDRQIVEGIKRYLREEKRDALTESLDVNEDDDSEELPPIEVEDKEIFRADERAMYREGLRILSEPLRTAVILRYFENWQIESDDPDEATISRHFNKTPRTIRNWLKKADEELKKWRGGQQ